MRMPRPTEPHPETGKFAGIWIGDEVTHPSLSASWYRYRDESRWFARRQYWLEARSLFSGGHIHNHQS